MPKDKYSLAKAEGEQDCDGNPIPQDQWDPKKKLTAGPGERWAVNIGKKFIEGVAWEDLRDWTKSRLEKPADGDSEVPR